MYTVIYTVGNKYASSELSCLTVNTYQYAMSSPMQRSPMASSLTIQRGRVADFLVENNYQLTALEFHQELLLEGSVNDVPKLQEFLIQVDTQAENQPAEPEHNEPSIEPDATDSKGVLHLDKLVLDYLRQRGFGMAAMALAEQVEETPQEPGSPSETNASSSDAEPTLLPLYQFAIDVFKKMKREDAKAQQPEEAEDEEAAAAGEAPGEDCADAEDACASDQESEPDGSADTGSAAFSKLEAENLSLRAQLQEVQAPQTAGGPQKPTMSASLQDQRAVVDLLAAQLPLVVPNVLISKREPLIPILLRCVELHEDHQKRDELTSILFNLIKRPDTDQRKLILDGCVALALRTEHSGRIESELIPQLWEELSHKHPERRALVADAIGALAPHVADHLRGSLLISMLKQMNEEEREAEVCTHTVCESEGRCLQVRILIADNLRILVSHLHELDDKSKMRDVLDLMLDFTKHSDPQVELYHWPLCPTLRATLPCTVWLPDSSNSESLGVNR